MKKLIMILSLVCMIPQYAAAQENKTTTGKSDWFAFGVLELAAVVNSYAASKSPGGYGAGMIILYPLLEKPENTKEFWGGWAVMSILPAYNFYLDRQLEDGIITRRDVFKKNMVAWHLLGAIAYFSLQGEEASTEKKGGSLGIAFSPSNQGTQVSLHYQF